ncbi:uncharacterized protein LOC129594636 [Paramacrobiotus metropolitanus]|uniref:uncharacterized protein LOC129594636 n=1 Tax=Paramacrobiotus metropolitanus TaxID=2943436 RepID=UPI002445702A|nr:uncharacterized protein LOC129594636 [Paramacrobiotus metropolitanus]
MSSQDFYYELRRKFFIRENRYSLHILPPIRSAPHNDLLIPGKKVSLLPPHALSVNKRGLSLSLRRDRHNAPFSQAVCLVWDLMLVYGLVKAAGGENGSGSGFVICACNTEECISQGTQRCVASNMCFAQDNQIRSAGADSSADAPPETRIVRGCINRSTPLLCENRPPATSAFARRMMANWPLLHCCTTDLCNQEVIPTLPPWFPSDLSAEQPLEQPEPEPAIVDEADEHEPIEPAETTQPIKTRPRFRFRRPPPDTEPTSTTVRPATIDYGQLARPHLDDTSAQDLASWSEMDIAEGDLHTPPEIVTFNSTNQPDARSVLVISSTLDSPEDLSSTHANLLYIVVPGVGLVALFVALCLLVVAVRRAGVIYGSIPATRPDLLKQKAAVQPTLQIVTESLGGSGRLSSWSTPSVGSSRLSAYDVALQRERMVDQENPYSVWTVMQAGPDAIPECGAQDPYHYNRMALYGYRNAGATS